MKENSIGLYYTSKTVVVFLLLNIMDLALTLIFNKLSPNSEANMLLNSLGIINSPLLLVLWKVVFSIGIVYLLGIFKRLNCLKYINVGLCVAVVINLVMIGGWIYGRYI